MKKNTLNYYIMILGPLIIFSLMILFYYIGTSFSLFDNNESITNIFSLLKSSISIVVILLLIIYVFILNIYFYKYYTNNIDRVFNLSKIIIPTSLYMFLLFPYFFTIENNDTNFILNFLNKEINLEFIGLIFIGNLFLSAIFWFLINKKRKKILSMYYHTI